jgi:hypothetical protein
MQNAKVFHPASLQRAIPDMFHRGQSTYPKRLLRHRDLVRAVPARSGLGSVVVEALVGKLIADIRVSLPAVFQ